MPSLWEVFLSLKDVKIRFTVIITFKSIVKTHQCYRRCWKMLLSWPNALRHCLLSRVFPQKLLNTLGGCLFVLPECVYLFYKLRLLNFPENKKSYKVLNLGKKAKDCALFFKQLVMRQHATIQVHVWTASAFNAAVFQQESAGKFWCHFPGPPLPSKHSIQNLVIELETTESLLDKKAERKETLLTRDIGCCLC